MEKQFEHYLSSHPDTKNIKGFLCADINGLCIAGDSSHKIMTL